MTPDLREGPLRVALVSGLLVHHDAISNSLRLKLDLLRRLRDAGQPIEVTAFVRATDQDEPDVVTVADVSELARHPGFRYAAAHLFEFGIYYDLFDAVFLLEEKRHVLAVYHNITPLDLLVDPVTRDAVERALVQKHNLARAGRIICDSEYNRDDLIAFGIEPERLVVHHLPPARVAVARSEPAATDPVELVFLGRLVRSKGVSDLLMACDRLEARGIDDYVLHLVGAPSFSEPDVLAEVRQWGASHRQLRFAGELDDTAVADLMSRADALVLPSYHEGYCVPVVEAYAAGCQVVAYDSTNLPNVVGDVGLLVPTGDVEALADALERVVASARARRAGEPVEIPATRGSRSLEAWQSAVALHLLDFRLDTYEAAFFHVLAQATADVAPLTLSGPAR